MPMVKAPLTIEHGLLGFVRQQPLHGYEIAQRLRATEELGLSWGWKQSQVYAELLHLEQEGYLTSEVETQATRPPRKVFRLTATGDAAFEAWIASPVPHGRDFQLEFPAKLYFAQQEGGDAARALVSRQQEACHAWLAGLRSQEPQHEAGQDYARLVQQFRVSQIETILAWLATCAKQLGAERGAGVA
ncbi:PadR family transcriptional regulator [Oscillochloris sp. ZM17-4]|uniref:PadR family transcriptional regulator n=1 Tax=Oscillochloris sp. ZM17-4 TaxID=2866714 RepID=UPI001C72D085|nr:PadR family transcriptional regulator [Oscillochloris sp. ZM17-4]MBX0327893.1 PadR family transcriptional regulator [Oscillochloris sp. ZM17-4]